MTRTNLYVNKCKQSRSYLNHLVLICVKLSLMSVRSFGCWVYKSSVIQCQVLHILQTYCCSPELHHLEENHEQQVETGTASTVHTATNVRSSQQLCKFSYFYLVCSISTMLWIKSSFWLILQSPLEVNCSLASVKISCTLWNLDFNTLRTGDVVLRFYITTVQDGWRKSAFLTRASFPCTIHLIMQYTEPVSEWSCWRMFVETWPHSELIFSHRASSI